MAEPNVLTDLAKVVDRGSAALAVHREHRIAAAVAVVHEHKRAGARRPGARPGDIQQDAASSNGNSVKNRQQREIGQGG